jgi:ADP-ribose pyrophosphatase YjhB (NUDIX family)
VAIRYQFCPQCKGSLTAQAEGPHCQACGITIYRNVVGAAAILPIRDGQVLLSRRAREPFKGSYDLIGGFIVPGETPEQAAVREAKEETGLEIRVTGLLGIYSDQYGDGDHTLGVHYLGEVAGGIQKAGDDAAALEWVSVARLPDEALNWGFQNVQQSLRDLQNLPEN